METGEYGLNRGTCFIARRLEVVAVAGLLWISWCVLGAQELLLLLFFVFFSSKNAQDLLQVGGRLATFCSLLGLRLFFLL